MYMAAMVLPSMAQPLAFSPPLRTESRLSGMIRAGSMRINTPSPVHFLQAPKGLLKEIKIEFAPFEFYEWRNISIIRFVEDGKSYLRIRTTTPGIRAMAWSDKPVTTAKKKKQNIIKEEALEVVNAAQAVQADKEAEGEKS